VCLHAPAPCSILFPAKLFETHRDYRLYSIDYSRTRAHVVSHARLHAQEVEQLRWNCFYGKIVWTCGNRRRDNAYGCSAATQNFRTNKFTLRSFQLHAATSQSRYHATNSFYNAAFLDLEHITCSANREKWDERLWLAVIGLTYEYQALKFIFETWQFANSKSENCMRNFRYALFGSHVYGES